MGTLLVQVGDIVDRGPQATEAWECLKHLQATSPEGSAVVRLVGNHELWWLEGATHDRNKKADTKAKVTKLVDDLKDSISSGTVRGSYHTQLHGEDILFVHAGFRRKMKAMILPKSGVENEAAFLANYVQTALRNEVQKCLGSGTFCSSLKGEVFGAGPERGGRSVGGPFWTDYSVIHSEESDRPSKSMIQVCIAAPSDHSWS